MASNIIVEKVPQKSPRFNTNVESKSKTLYLELVENVEKIQDGLVGKDYVPPAENTLPDHLFPPDIYPDLGPEPEPEPPTPSNSTTSLTSMTSLTPSTPFSAWDSHTGPSVAQASSSKFGGRDYGALSETLGARAETLGGRLTTPVRVKTPPRETRITTPVRDTHKQALFGMLKDDGTVHPPNLHALIHPKQTTPMTSLNEEDTDDDNDEDIEQNPDDLKRELIFKISLYKKQNPTADIPTFTFADDIKTIEFHYRNCLKLSSVTNTAEKYKTYLIGAFMVVEMVFGKFLKFDMKGFAEEQISKMSSYEALLIELGEKQYVPMESQWSVEVRLLLLVLTNTAMFIAMKMLTSKLGFDVSGIADKIGGVIKGGGKDDNKGKNEKRMKGPTFNFDDLEMKEEIPSEEENGM
jgi:hypothetical protein